MPYSAGAAAFKLAYEISPITLTGGVAQSIPGGMLPIISIASSVFSSLLGSADPDQTLDDAFANFFPLPGSSLIDNQIGNYPFANMAIAANCIIAQPLVCSLLMRVPVKDAGGYAQKLSLMTALQNTLDQHNKSGGTYTVATPSFFYTNLILIGLHDVSDASSLQAQMQYKWDFIQPLVTLQQAAGAQNAMMNALSSGVATQGNLSGISSTLGSPGTIATPGIAPAAQASASSGIGG